MARLRLGCGKSKCLSEIRLTRLNPVLGVAALLFAARFTEFWYLLKARLSLLAGRRGRARAALKSALRRNPNSFVAHFLLGRVYWRERTIVKAKREFDVAWQIDPERFERAYARLRSQYEGAPELFAYPGAEEERPWEVHVSVREPARIYGDFRTEAERQRFENLPPITRDEITSIDWERFESELLSDGDR